MTRRSALLLLLLALALPGARPVVAADEALLLVGEGQPFVQYWTPRDFHGGAYCLGLAQDARGVMYVGNQGAVLEYDGVTWRQVSTHDTGFTAGLAYDAPTDTVFVGKSHDLGYLKREPGGERTYVSLHDQMPSEARSTGNFFGVHATPEGIYFVGTDRVMRWRGGRFDQTWKLATDSFPFSRWVAGHLYVASASLGLLRLEGEEFVAASADPFFHDTDVVGMVTEPDGALLLATYDQGFYFLRDGVAHPAPSECDAFLQQEGVQRLARLRDGSLAVGTAKGGVVVLDRERRFRCRLDKPDALPSSDVSGLLEDAEGGLWISQYTGVARAEVDSPLSVIRAGRDEDLSTVLATAHWGGTMAFGSNGGIHRLAPAEPAAAVGPRLELLAGGITADNGLCTVPDGVLVNDAGRIQFVDKERRVTEVSKNDVPTDLVASRRYPGRVYYVTQGGHVGTLRHEEGKGWVKDRPAAELGVTGQFGLWESAEAGLWVGTAEHGLFRVQFDPTGDGKVTSFFDRPGPLRGENLVSVCKGVGPVFKTTHHGLCRWDERTQSVEELAGFGERLQDPATSIDEGVAYDTRSLWLTFINAHDPPGERFRGRVLAGEAGEAPIFQPLPRKIEEVIGRVSTFYPVEAAPAPLRSLLIFGASGNGAVRLDVGRWEAQMRAPPSPTKALVRRAFTTQEADAGKESPILQGPLPYARHTVHFEFAAGTLAFGVAPRFQTRLAGFGAGEWSAWSERASADYLNLPEGRYTFEVRARDADGQTGGVAALRFRVLPPWQRSPWAYAGYALAAAAGVWALVRWRGRQLRHRNAELETVVATRTGELVRARDDADAANRAKSAFLANMSHELRTPLNAVLGYAQLLLKQPGLTARSREQATIIGQSGGHLLALVNEVLDLAKVEAGKLTLTPFDFSLGQLLDEVAASFRPRLAEKKLSYTEHRAPGLPTIVHTDPARLRQVLFNLLSNAVKFTWQGGVTLSVEPAGEDGKRRVRFEVADTGVGIAPEDQREVFVAFYQAGDSQLASQGTGLGLTISQRLVGLLGGRIELESTPGRGSRFWFELPLFEVAAEDELPVCGAADAAVLGKIKGYEGATRRLLLVDDLHQNRQVLRDFLQPLGFEIEEAADGVACLAACARAMPHAVLLDLRLGTPDGFEVARTLRARTDGGVRPGIVAISASVFEHDRQQAIDAGCDDFLPKPFEEAQLLGVLGRVLGLQWVREAEPTTPEPSAESGLAEAEGTLPADEIGLLRELALSGDAEAIRQHLDAWRAKTPGRADKLVRRLDSLVATYDMEAIDELLLTLSTHDGK